MNEWQLAIRKINGKGMLFEGNVSDFCTIPNSTRYWYADPFLFDYNGKEYLFVEMFDRKKNKGSIGYAELKNPKKMKFRQCIELPYHLSYPCIYEFGGDIYMIPECYQSESVVSYKCISFPDKWVLDKVITDKIAVDTTPYNMDGECVYFTTFFKSKNKRFHDNLYMIDSKGIRQLKSEDLHSRSAGNIFRHKDIIIRPSQNCEREYGSGLVFSQIDCLTKTDYSDHELICIYPPSANGTSENTENRIQLKNDSKRQWCGVHTYNFSSNYEVIDLKYNDGKNIYAFLRHLKDYLNYKFYGNSKNKK